MDIAQLEKKYSTDICLCFIKISSLKKQVIGETLNAVLNLTSFELLGSRIVDAKNQMYLENVPTDA